MTDPHHARARESPTDPLNAIGADMVVPATKSELAWAIDGVAFQARRLEVLGKALQYIRPSVYICAPEEEEAYARLERAALGAAKVDLRAAIERVIDVQEGSAYGVPADLAAIVRP